MTSNNPTPNARLIYADIIDLPHHQSLTHPQMSLYDRAAQFAPFAALTGYEDMINEEARVTDSAVSLTESYTDVLGLKLNIISDAIKNGQHPVLSITYFVPDSNKSGGKYVTVKDKIKKIDTLNKAIVLMKTIGVANVNQTIDLASITDIQGDLVNHLNISF